MPEHNSAGIDYQPHDLTDEVVVGPNDTLEQVAARQHELELGIGFIAGQMSDKEQRLVRAGRSALRVTGEAPKDKNGRVESFIGRKLKQFRYFRSHKPEVFDRQIIDHDTARNAFAQQQDKIAFDQGHGEVDHLAVAERYSEVDNELTRGAEDMISEQKQSRDQWLNYMLGPDAKMYPKWFTYYTLTNASKLQALTKIPDRHDPAKAQIVFPKRSSGTTRPFPELNREAIGQVYNHLVDDLTSGDNPGSMQTKSGLNSRRFADLYAHYYQQATAERQEALTTDGSWRTFKQGTPGKELAETIQNHGTGWCTAGERTAESQLANGDFYVYYSEDEDGNETIPRIAIRMEGNNIAEVRGVNPGQDLEPEMVDIMTEKLQQFDGHEEYLQKAEDVKRLTSIYKAAKKAEGKGLAPDISLEDLRFIYEIDRKIETFGYDRDPRMQELILVRGTKHIELTEGEDALTPLADADILNRQAISDISMLTGLEPAAIETQWSRTLKWPDVFSGRVEYFYGDIDTTGSDGFPSGEEGEKLYAPRVVSGNFKMFLDDEMVDSIAALPEVVGGDVYISQLQSLRGDLLPREIGGGLDMPYLKWATGAVFPKELQWLDVPDLRRISATTQLPQVIREELNISSLHSFSGATPPALVQDGLFAPVLHDADGLPHEFGGDTDLQLLEKADELTFANMGGPNRHIDIRSLSSATSITFPRKLAALDMRSITADNMDASNIRMPEEITQYLILSDNPPANLNIPDGVEVIYASDAEDTNIWTLTGWIEDGIV